MVRQIKISFPRVELKKKPRNLRARGVPRVKRLSLDVIIEQTEGKQGEWHATSRLNQEDRRESSRIDL